MIFVAVGTQFPFDRMIRIVDEWVGDNNESAFAQIAEGKYIPKNMQWKAFIDADEYNRRVEQADLVVAHAGMGNIITAREKQVPIIVMNRQYKLGEHRNDHQADGLKWMDKLTGVYAAPDNKRLIDLLNRYKTLEKPTPSDNQRQNDLIQFIASCL